MTVNTLPVVSLREGHVSDVLDQMGPAWLFPAAMFLTVRSGRPPGNVENRRPNPATDIRAPEKDRSRIRVLKP
jgi:hypothetical protein